MRQAEHSEPRQGKEITIMELLIIALIFVVFALMAWRWGYDSRHTEPAHSWEQSRAHTFLRQHHL